MQGVEFLGFAADCTITAKMTMFGERLTDFLNGQERFHIHQVNARASMTATWSQRTASRSSATTCSPSIASGPRGSEQQRVELADEPAAALDRAVPDPRPGPHGAGHRCRCPSVMTRDPMVPADERDDRLLGGRRHRRARRGDDDRQPQADGLDLRPTDEAATLLPDVTVRSPFAAQLHAEQRRRAST